MKGNNNNFNKHILFGFSIVWLLFILVNSWSLSSVARNENFVIDDLLRWEMRSSCEVDLNEITKVHNSVSALEDPEYLPTIQPRSLLPEIIHEQPTQTCIPQAQVNIEMYMYHYVRPTRRDAKWSVVYNNSVTPEIAREHYKHLNLLQNQGKIQTAFLSELEQFQSSDCFPHERIILLTFDDWRRDNYHFLLPLAKEFNIKSNLWIVADRIAFSEDTRVDSFMLFDEIRWMIDSWLFEIQSHSGTHTDLQQKNREAQRSEICESTKYFEQLFGVQMNTIIYPMWLYNTMSTQVARECWLTYWLTTIEWGNSVNDLSDYPFQLSRYRVSKRITWWELYWR